MTKGHASPWLSTIGLKILMAVSGFVLVGFVLGHMAGNLQIFAGQDVFNDYAAFMQGLGGLLWAARLGLLAALGLHVGSAVKLTARNLAARPTRYEGLKPARTSMHARYMMWTGVTILLYLGYHLAHFTIGVAHPEHFAGVDALGRHDVYNNFVLSFQNPVITILYCAANLAVASHLAHAVTSIFRTIGLSRGALKSPLHKVGPAIGIIVATGNLSMPLACLFGIITPVGY
jgi:succinate dehydrogenase / fumarate reductase cytochrome b subunit